jgi:uncharacterized membrane protein YeaQ/YmgE (transglycosylase-associated protein family)
MFAEVVLNPGGILSWLAVGLIAGWLAGLFMKGGGYGIVADIILGLIGAALGGFLTQYFVQGEMWFWGSVFVAFIGACVLIGIARAIAPTRSPV